MREQRRPYGRTVGGIGRACLVRRVPDGHVPVVEVVRGRLVGRYVDGDAVGHQAGQDLGDVADERDGRGVGRTGEVGDRRFVVRRDAVDPARLQPAPRALAVDLDDQSAASQVRDGKALRAAHAAEPGRDHPSSGERAAEVAAGDGGEGLVGEAQDPLGADVEPGRGRHLPVHGESGVLQATELRLVRPGGHHHGGRDQYARRVGVGRQHRHGLARLHHQRLVGAQPFEGGDDRVVRLPGAGGPAAAAVYDEAGRVLGDGGIERVEEAAQYALLFPATAAEFGTGRRRNAEPSVKFGIDWIHGSNLVSEHVPATTPRSG